jgi:glycosyltransferase involved in cell wall biosynthesis
VNVLHIDEQRGWRGGEQQASYLIAGLAAKGHKVIIAGRKDGAFVKADHGAPDAPRAALPFLSELDIYTAWRIVKAVRQFDVDILHAHTSHAHTMACIAQRLAKRGKVVVSRRVDFVPKASALNKWKYRAPDRIIAISKRIADVLREFGVDNSKLATVHSGIDPSRFDVDPLTRSELGVPEGAPLIGNVAALVGHKDHATLIDAMALVLKNLPEAHLVIGGEGDLRPKLEAQINALGIGAAVHLLGYRKDVPRLLRALDLFVLSSKEEGLGTSVLDAMASGVPVAATDGGGIPEMVKHEETGLLSPTQDAAALAANIVRLLQNASEAAGLADNAQTMVQRHYTAQAMVEGNLRVYEDVLAES